MAEALKRWTGSEWVTVAVVNRIEVGGAPTGETVFVNIMVKMTTIDLNLRLVTIIAL